MIADQEANAKVVKGAHQEKADPQSGVRETTTFHLAARHPKAHPIRSQVHHRSGIAMMEDVCSRTEDHRMARVAGEMLAVLRILEGLGVKNRGWMVPGQEGTPVLRRRVESADMTSRLLKSPGRGATGDRPRNMLLEACAMNRSHSCVRCS